MINLHMTRLGLASDRRDLLVDFIDFCKRITRVSKIYSDNTRETSVQAYIKCNNTITDTMNGTH